MFFEKRREMYSSPLVTIETNEVCFKMFIAFGDAADRTKLCQKSCQVYC